MPMMVKGNEPDEQQPEHGEPSEARSDERPAGSPAKGEDDDAEERHHVAGQDLRGEVGARLQWRDAQLAGPAHLALLGDACARGDHRGHGSPRGHAGHVIEGKADAVDRGVAVVAGDASKKDQREDQGEDQEAAVAKRTQHLVANVDELHELSSPGSSPVRSKNASSSPAPRTSMSRAWGY